VEGKDIFPRVGEFNPTIIRNGAVRAGLLSPGEDVTPRSLGSKNLDNLPLRPPLLCPGCPHRGVFVTLKKLKLVVNGDIGCYTLGFLPPLSALHTCGCMGASIGVAHGVNKVGMDQKNIAVLGDSTFFHTGLPALLNVAYNKGDTVTIILDNLTTAMTGHQENPGTGRTLGGEESTRVDFLELARSLGIKHTYKVDPYNLKQTEDAIQDAIRVEGPAVIIAQRECVLLSDARKEWIALEVDPDQCNGCGLCFSIGCPAIVRSDYIDQKSNRYLAEIDSLLCTGCNICVQICARRAIRSREEMIEQKEAGS
jgi:indolepyruvate ferredoxin oxidoreductase alpha subunit